MFPFFLVSVGGDSAVQAPQIQMVDTTQQDTARYFGSQEEFADIAGVHRTYIGMIERAEKNITLQNIQKISNALKIKISDLFGNL